MHSYSNTLITCDRIMEIFTPQKHSGFKDGDIMGLLNISNGTPEAAYFSSAMERLKKDGHLLPHGSDNSYFKVGGDFFQFKEQGAYKEWVNNENLKETISDAINKSGISANEISIATGKSVQKLNDLLRPATIAQIIIAIVTLGIAGLAAWISWLNYQSTKTSNDLELRQKSTEKAIERIEQCTEKTQQPVMKDTVYKTW